MRVRLQITIDLDADPTTPVNAFVQQAREAVNELLAERPSVILMRGEDYIFPAPRQTKTLAEWLAPQGSPPEKVDLQMQKSETCMHSSPWVPGQGFLCGWC